MADSKELKPKSFRINEETADKFKEISNAIGGNQQETMAKLIEAFEFQSGKVVLKEKKEDIELFEKYITAITRMFMGSLEDNQNLTEIVRTEFDALLKSKDGVIQDLQKDSEKAKRLENENINLKNIIDNMKKEYESRINDMQTMLLDKDNLNGVLTDTCNNLKKQVENMKEETIRAKEIFDELSELKNVCEGNERIMENLKEQIQREKVSHEEAVEQLKSEMQFTLERTLFNKEKEFQSQIQSLKADSQAEIDGYQNKYLELLQKIQKESV